MTKRLPTRGQHHQSSNRKAQPPKAFGSGALPGIMHNPDALPQRDPRPWPARHGCPVSRLGHLEIIHASDVLDDAVAGYGPYLTPSSGGALGGMHRTQKENTKRFSKR
jgi:hypothetical protein